MSLAFDSFIFWATEAIPASAPAGVLAYNFNIAQSFNGFELEVVGSSYFDRGNSDWACEEAWTSRPHKYVVSYAEAGREWEPFLAWAAAAVCKFIESGLPGTDTLKQAHAVTVGFVDGELVIVAGRDS
jgi:hypothetical protein